MTGRVGFSPMSSDAGDTEAIRRGDLIRFSVALLRQLYDEPEHLSALVEVVEICLEPDGAKTLVLRRRVCLKGGS